MLPSPSIIAALAVTALPLFPAASVAAPLCRWVDEAGRTQISDESAGCCGPFRTTRGAIKPEAVVRQLQRDPDPRSQVRPAAQLTRRAKGR
jgi:hypothetical protein